MTDFRSMSIIRKTAQRVRRCQCEPLEHRILLSATADVQAAYANASAALLATAASPVISMMGPFDGVSYPGGVTVTNSEILTENESIPRFAAQPTIINVHSGNWADPSIWSLGRVPTDHDRVAIATNTSVSYSTVSDAALDAVEISGTLTFSASSNTRLTVANLTVLPTGTLQIGSASTPVAPGVTAELVIADQPLNLLNDPQQFGTGLIGLGTVSIHGSPVNQTWVKLGAEPQAGDNRLTVAGDISGWQQGDTLVLPDTRQVLTSQADPFLAGQTVSGYEDEEVTIDHIQGNQVYLTSPLQFSHLGAHNTSGGLELLPNVARLDHNVVIRSANPDGTRGYTLFTARANVDIEYASFQNLGRTDAFSTLDDTTVDSSGRVTHVGTNQSGRYAVYFDHLMGPLNATNTGSQFQFVGNTVDGSMKWAVALNDSSYGMLAKNVIYDAQGAGFVTCAGSEIANVFQNNITISMQGTYDDGSTHNAKSGDYARGGSGFWFRRGGNTVEGNVAADSSYSGFVIDGYYDTGYVTLPAFRGADTAQPGQGITTLVNPAAAFADNQAYGMSTYGIWLAYISGDDLAPNQPATTFYNLQLWNVFSVGVDAYHTSNVTFDNLLVLGDESAQNRNDEGTIGMDLEYYENRNLTITNSRIEGVRYGIIVPNNDASQAGIRLPTIIQNTTLIGYINILATPGLDDRPSNGNSLVVRDVKFGLITKLPSGPVAANTIPVPANIWLRASGNNGENVDYTQTSTVTVYDYNQVTGDDFQVFYREQVPSFIMPQTSASLLSGRNDGTIGSPQAGLTNLQNRVKYGIALAGGLAPAGATASRPEINGLIAPIQNLAAITPRVVLVTPWDGAQLIGNQLVKVRYNALGLMPPGGQIYFSLDGGTPFTQFIDGGLYNLSTGQHTLRAFIGGADGQQLPGTGPTATSSITVLPPLLLLDLNGPAAGTGFTANFVAGSGPVPIVDSANLTITDQSSTTLVAATATIVSPQLGDVLAVNTTGTNIAANFNGTSLTLTGSDTLADYQQVLRSITFNSTTLNPHTAARTIQLSVTDSTTANNTSPAAISTVVAPPINPTAEIPPTLDLNGPAAGTGFTAKFTIGNGPVPIVDSANLTVTNLSGATFVGAIATILNAQTGDVLAAHTAGTNITATSNGTAIQFSGSDTLADYQQVLRSVTFDNPTLNPSSTPRTILLTVQNANLYNNTSPVAYSTVVAPPTIDLNGVGTGTGFAATYVAGNAPLPIVDSANLTITDPSGATLVAATATLVAPQIGDVLAANTTGTKIVANFNGTSLALTGNDTLANYQQVLRSVTFNNTTLIPSTASRAIQFSVTDPTSTSPMATSTVNVLDSQITGRSLFYYKSPRYDVTNGSLPGFSDDNAIAIDKSAYLPGTTAATFANVSSYNRGVNGIMIDILGSHPGITVNDFIFRVGNSSNLNSWVDAPAPATVTVRAGSGSNPGSDRVELTWGANAPKNSWLEVIVMATPRTGLSANDVFFFGNAVGDTGLADSTAFSVNSADITGVQAHQALASSNIPITSVFDLNKDGQVSAADITLAQANQTVATTALIFLNVPAVGAFAAQSSAAPAASGDSTVASALSSTSTSQMPPAISPSTVNNVASLGSIQAATAKYFEQMADKGTPNDSSIVVGGSGVEATTPLDDHLLDSLLAGRGLK
jgi:hypothetical protein